MTLHHHTGDVVSTDSSPKDAFLLSRLTIREYRRSYGVRRRGWANSHVMRPGRGWRRPWEPQNSLRGWRAWGGREGDCKWRMANVQFGRRGFAGHSLPAMRHA